MDNRVDIFQILRQQGKLTKVLVYPATETVDDPFEKTTTKSFLNPIAIDALVKDISQEGLRWKFFGTLQSGSKQVIVEKKYKETFKTADKIKIGTDYYKTWKDDLKSFGIISRENYIVVILEAKNSTGA